MNANTQIDLETLHTAIIADVRANFPQLNTVDFYLDEPEDRKRLPTPACVMNISEFEYSTDNDSGTEQLPLILHFEAELIINSIRTEFAAKEIRKLAAAFMHFMNKRKWNDPNNPGKKLPTGVVCLSGGYPDVFDVTIDKHKVVSEMDRYQIWRIEWHQQVDIGESVWNEDGAITPGEILYSWAPDIGNGNEHKYENLQP